MTRSLLHCLAAALLTSLLVSIDAAAETPLDAARTLLARYHEDPTRIDRARVVLSDAVERAGRGDGGADVLADTLIALSRICFLHGDLRATSDEEKLASYDHGRTVGKRALALAPQNADAHLWYAINSGRWAETKGIVRALFVLPTLREEVGVILQLNPSSAEGYALAGSLDFEVPTLLGGDRARAEERFKQALALDPRRTGIRIELARLYIASKRYAEARDEIERVLAEPSPSDLPYWTLRDVPRARHLLETVRDRR